MIANASPMAEPRTASQFDRMPPHDLPAEMCLIASLMLSGDDPVLYAKVGGVVDRADFFQADHQVLYDALLEMRRKRRPIDGVLLSAYLAERHLLEEIGGDAYLGQLLNTVPSAAHAEHYARVVHDMAVRRGLIAIGNEAIAAGYGPGDRDDVAAALSSVGRRASALSTTGRAQEVHRLGDVAAEVVAAHRSGRASRLLPTGINDLDNVIGGLPIGGQTVVAGRPGMGKSMLAKQVLLNLSGRHPVGVISVEETRHKIAENALSNRAGVINARLHQGTASADEWRRAAEAAEAMRDAPVHIVDSAATLPAILAVAELLALRHGCRAIVVDHLHIIDGQPGRHENREQEVSKISSGLKFAWKQLDVAGVCCAQLNRGGGRDRPTLTSLRDSGSLEQDGDVVLLLHREDYYRKQDGNAELDGSLEVIVAKNKSGGTGIVTLEMDESTQRIADRGAAGVSAANAHFGVPADVAATFDAMD